VTSTEQKETKKMATLDKLEKYDTVTFSGHIMLDGKSKSGYSAVNDKCTITLQGPFVAIERLSQDGSQILKTLVHVDKVQVLHVARPA
jgi:hypothetical protein